MLLHTHLDIEGNALRLPFPCFALVFTDRTVLELGEALIQLDEPSKIRGERLQILTVYVTRFPGTEPDVLGLKIDFFFDSGTGTWPYILGRDLYVRPSDRLDAILDSHFPEIRTDTLDPIFLSPELKQLLHLVVNAVLYATSAAEWSVAESPLKRLQRSAKARGEKKRRRVANRVNEEKTRHSSEDVFYLPGKIPISQVRKLRELAQSSSGQALMARFMVRGHWRRANPSWIDQHVRWIEPYWTGPDMATIIEREYKMKV